MNRDRIAMGLAFGLMGSLGLFLIAGNPWPLVAVIGLVALFLAYVHADRLPVEFRRWANDWRCGWGYVAALLVTFVLWGAA